MGLLQNIVNAGKKVINVGLHGVPAPQGVKKVDFVMPLDVGPAKAASGAFAGTKNLISKGFSIAKKELLGAPKAFIPTVKGALKGAAVATGAMTAGKYAVTGKLEMPSARTFTELVSLRTAPVSTIAGNIEGAGQLAGLNFKKLVNAGKKEELGISQIGVNDTNDMLNTQLLWLQSQARNFSGGLPSPQSTINISMPATPQLQAPSTPSFNFSPSVSGSTGSGEILPLLLLLAAGAGGAGYLMGRRKKKKYKKRKRR